MEWLDKGSYTYELWSPPLPRVLVALGPYLLGGRSHSQPNAYQEGNAILHAGRSYWRNLAVARLGTLPFFMLSCFVVWRWSSQWFGSSGGLWSLALYSTLPPVLGHAGLATPDTATEAAVLMTLYAMVLWLEVPSPKRAALLGLAGGFTLLTKFSAVAFLPASALAGALFLLLMEYRGFPIPIVPSRQARQLGISLLVAAVLAWAGYRFSMEPWITRGEGGGTCEGAQPPTDLARAVHELQRTPVPLLQIPKGLYQLKGRMDYGADSYLLGEYRRTGWWYFFPIVLLVKSPLGFLALALAGCLMAISSARMGQWRHALPAVFALAIVGVSMLSKLNLGVRYVLAVYPLVSILAGAVIARSLRTPSHKLLRPAVVLCIVLTLLESARAHPDYLAHFNLLAGRYPERILAESDLDWGQDLERLRQRLNDRGVRQIALAYFGTADLEKSGLPEIRKLSPWSPAAGYLAVSVHHLSLSYAKDGSYGWLHRYSPVERVGRSIFLYYIPDSSVR
jgi:hypothetical protein